MKTSRLKALSGPGLLICIMIEGNNPGMPFENEKSFDGNLPDEENRNQDGITDDIIPAGEEQNMPDPEEYNEDTDVEDDVLEEIPLEEPVPDLDEIEPDEEINIEQQDEGIV